VNPTLDDTDNNQQTALQTPMDPVLTALLSTGAPVQGQPTAQAPLPPPADPASALSPPGMTPSTLTPPGGPVPAPADVGSPVNPYGPAPTSGVPGPNPYVGTPTEFAKPPAAVPSPSPTKAGDVNAATGQQNAALNAETGAITDAALAKVDALSQHAQSTAAIMEGHATAQGLVDQQYQAGREAARKDADAETAAWLRDVDKKVKEDPSPSHWFDSLSGFGKVLWFMSLAFGSLAQAKNPNIKNVALEMISAEVDADMARQKDKLKNQLDVLKQRGDKIDKRMQERIADAKDDHTLMANRLTVIEQAAMERANAPGSADVKAAMADAAKWAGEKRLEIAGQRADKAYAEREGKLNRDAENARSYLQDKRNRDIAAANIQKDYDLARMQASVKLSAKETERMKDSVVLNPNITGIRVVDNKTGAPVNSPLSQDGGLTVSKPNERMARQTAEAANDKYAAMQRVSRELGKDEDFTVLLKRNPGLISDIVKLGYQGARNELDPNGRVTDKDFVAGLEHELGGDLDTLSGRVASATFSAGQDKLKTLVDKHIRDYPAFVSNKLGSMLDAAVPGYEGDIRVDWSPKKVEIDPAGLPSTRQIDESYGIHSTVKAPNDLGELKTAQDLEAKGVEALPAYKAGSHDRVTKALEDFKGAMPQTIIDRAGSVAAELDKSGDKRASLEVTQAEHREVKEASKHLQEVTSVLRTWANLPKSGDSIGRQYLEHGEDRALGTRTKDGSINPAKVVDLAKYHGLTQLTGQDVLDIIERAGLKPGTSKE